MKMHLKVGEKIRVIDDMIFPNNIPIGTTGYFMGKGKNYIHIAFYPNGERFDHNIELDTELGDYLERV